MSSLGAKRLLFAQMMPAAVAMCSVATAGLVALPTPVVATGCTLLGAGTSADPRLIATVGDLEQLTGPSPACGIGADAHYRLTADLNLSGRIWEGIGDPRAQSDLAFEGTWDGDGHTISGLGTSRRPADVGLFWLTEGAEILNTHVEVFVDHTDFGGAEHGFTMGALVAEAADGTRIADSSATGVVRDLLTSDTSAAFGGLVGLLDDSRIERSSADVDVTADLAAGGLVGYVQSDTVAARIVDSSAVGDVTGDESIGGLIGEVGSCQTAHLRVENSYARGSVSGLDAAATAGFIGVIDFGTACEDRPDSITGIPIVLGNLWDTDTSGQSVGSNPAVAGTGRIEGRTTAQLRRVATYTEQDWAIVDGWAPTGGDDVWGICPAANDGTAFLLWQYAANPCTYVPEAPARFLDTRPTGATFDGIAQREGPIAANTTYELQITGRNDIPADASAVTLNLTVVEADGPGFATVWPCGEPKPDASNLNFVGITTVANAVIAKIGEEGRVCISLGQAAANVLVDVNGYFPAGTAYAPEQPARYLDTRPTGATFDGIAQRQGPIAANTTYELQITGRGAVADTATSVVLNLTVVEAAGPGFATVWPCGEPKPDASNLNFVGITTVANAVITKIGEEGQVCISLGQAAANVLVDVNGSFSDELGYLALQPARYLDTRPTGVTFDGDAQRQGPIAANTTYELQIGDRGNVPDDAQAVTLNITIVEAADNGFATVWPCDAPRPDASSLNFVGVRTIANAVVSKLAADGTVCIALGQSSADVLVDVNGYFP